MPGFPHAMPMHGLVGGLLIGLAAALMLLGNGRVAGCSGMFTRAAGLASTGAPRGVAIAFTLGLPIGAGIAAWLVGAGCTSGHGVVGMARLSPRSMVATLAFMAAGIATVAVLRSVGWVA